MTWSEIVKAHPHKWVALKNVVMDGPDVIEGEICLMMRFVTMRMFTITKDWCLEEQQRMFWLYE